LIKETILQFQTGQSSLKTPDIWRSAQLLYLLGQQVTMLLITASLFIIALRDNKYPSDLSEIDFVFLIFGLISLILLVRKIRTGEKLMRK
jgi:hypothetical protein